ncbi:endonuclease domain-containing protein [Phenylobacterium aquaticum]|nr:endonuclease domain-containing protein [Phenylobacterium aquaticum]
MTLPEALLWRALKGRQFLGLHFRKQHPVGPYILDFYCDSTKLCVEVDGYVHGTEDRPERDARRDVWLRSLGIRTLRLSARLVLKDMDATLRTIEAEIEAGGAQPSCSPLGGAGREAD